MAQGEKILKKTQNLLDKLVSGNEKKILQTIELLEAEGNEHVIVPLYDLYKTTTLEAVKEAVVVFFNDLSDSRAMPVMIDLIRQEEDTVNRKMLLSTCWQNKLDFTPYLADFVAVAADGDFFEAFESLTVIENLEGPFEETQILESQLYLKEFLEKEKGKNNQKDQILSEIAILIKDFDRSIQS